jgi:Tub family
MADPSDDSWYKLLENIDPVLIDPVPLSADHQCQPQRHPDTGLVHCVMTRKASASYILQRATTSYQFSLQIPTERGAGPSTKLIFTAEKDSGRSYSIYTTASNGCTMKIASLGRIQMNMYSISYVLKNINGVSMAYITYHVPSPVKVLHDPPARHAEIAIYHPTKATSATFHISEENDEMTQFLLQSPAKSTFFDHICTSSIMKHHNLANIANAVNNNNEDVSVRVLQSLVPYKHATTGRVTLNFHGRGQFASPKNMQLVSLLENEVNSTDPTKVVSLQMCKWETDTYHIDYDDTVPIQLLQAFAFGLAQVDL